MIFREVERNIDRINELVKQEEERRIREEGYLKIKPETEMNDKEVDDFWNDIFM